MTTLQFTALAAALLLSSTAVSAQAQSAGPPMAAEPATQPAPAHAAKNSRDPNQVICKREAEIGSRLGGHQDCRTRADWDQIARDSEQAVTLMQSRSGPGVTGH